MTVGGRTISNDEMAGIANLVFAGGRDTVINSVTTIISLFANRRDELRAIAGDRLKTNLAVEEIVRAASPLTHIGRVCRAGAAVDGNEISPNARASLCWAAANYDPRIFGNPDDLKLDRTPNPHLGFGSGPHICLGAAHARAILRILITRLNSDTAEIKISDVEPQREEIADFTRTVGYAHLSGHIE